MRYCTRRLPVLSLFAALLLLATSWGPVGAAPPPAASAAAYLVTSPAWSPLPVDPEAAWGASGAYAAGKFFAIGGITAAGVTGKVRIYDPATGAWSTGPNDKPMPVLDACAATIGDLIYVVGGADGSIAPQSALEVLDAINLTWSTEVFDAMPSALLAQVCGSIGGVLYVAGGSNGATATSPAFAKLYAYDPAQASFSRWVEKTGMLEARRHAAGAVVGGKLYAVGGMVGGSEDQLATAEVYDPLSDTWSSVPELGQARAGAAAFGYGRRLVACGGRAAAPLASCEVYDPMSGGANWTAWPSLTVPRLLPAYAAAGNVLYVSGGYHTSILDSAESAAGTGWEPLPPIHTAMRRGAAVYAADKLFVIEGQESSYSSTGLVHIYDPATGLWSNVVDAKPTPAYNICASAIGDQIYVAGGTPNAGSYADVLDVLDAVSLEWSTVTTDPLPAATYGHACGVVGGKLYLAGGSVGMATTAAAYAYDPAAPAGSRWSSLAPLNTARIFAASAVVDGRLYVAGGMAAGGGPQLTSVEVYDPAMNTWTTLDRGLTEPRAYVSATAAGARLVVCGGGVSTAIGTCEAYNTRLGVHGSFVGFAPMRDRRAAFAMASDGRHLYAAGGTSGLSGAFLASVETIDAGPFEVIASVFLPILIR
jgi:N-acetylneuraminic acid mutarotase